MPIESKPRPLSLLEGSVVVAAPRALVFKLLVDPREQMRWNSLYRSISEVSDDPVREGSTFTGRFKGSGPATVTFERVRPGIDFVHRSAIAIAGRIVLGHMRHTYAVSDAPGGTLFTQTIEFSTTGLGRLLGGMLNRAFAKRLPESFEEFRAFVEGLPEARP